MKLSYDPRYNIAYLRLREKIAEVETIQISSELNIDLTPDGKICGIEFLNANEQLQTLEPGKFVFTDETTGKTVQFPIGRKEILVDKLIFLNIGWMKNYRGLDGDTIKGGGSFVGSHGYGFEIFNFQPFQGRMYGYVERPSIALERLGARPSADSVSGVLTVWVATNPWSGGRYIVGWYNDATVYRRAQNPPPGVNRKIPPNIALPRHQGVDVPYFVSAKEQDCVLIPESQRDFRIPTGEGGMGQANIWYADRPNSVEIRRKIIEYVAERAKRS